MSRILKFPVSLLGDTTILTKSRPRILTVGVDGRNEPSIWVEAEEGTGYKTSLKAFYTGDIVNPRHPGLTQYIGTIFHHNIRPYPPFPDVSELLVSHIYVWYDVQAYQELLLDMSRI